MWSSIAVELFWSCRHYIRASGCDMPGLTTSFTHPLPPLLEVLMLRLLLKLPLLQVQHWLLRLQWLEVLLLILLKALLLLLPAAGNVAATSARNVAAVSECGIVMAAAAAGQIVAAAAGSSVLADKSVVIVDKFCRPAFHDLHGDHRCHPNPQPPGILDFNHSRLVFPGCF